MKNIIEYIKSEKSKLNDPGSLVRTPGNIDELFEHPGSTNPILVQQSIQFGYKLALENLEKEINK